ncbi:hypothetical protein F751_2220 [Auxenochlorella protothecoides]|uniref:Uncharacterized protein n=1 Tax=Auxenochlorella protothecoides TaxID=3075 RepID=A0A087SLM9_AUXPR|nr:hypothetical protein F751_2220 [Auxenochlorella protothecoides]KFM26633.1 hypothetical protein F751_2220 [Auxenochlorella protothecoides]
MRRRGCMSEQRHPRLGGATGMRCSHVHPSRQCCLYKGTAGSLPRQVSGLPLGTPRVPPTAPLLLAHKLLGGGFDDVVDLVVLLKVPSPPGEDVDVDVWHGLSCLGTVLDGKGQGARTQVGFQPAADLLGEVPAVGRGRGGAE